MQNICHTLLVSVKVSGNITQLTRKSEPKHFPILFQTDIPVNGQIMKWTSFCIEMWTPHESFFNGELYSSSFRALKHPVHYQGCIITHHYTEDIHFTEQI